MSHNPNPALNPIPYLRYNYLLTLPVTLPKGKALYINEPIEYGKAT